MTTSNLQTKKKGLLHWSMSLTESRRLVTSASVEQHRLLSPSYPHTGSHTHVHTILTKT